MSRTTVDCKVHGWHDVDDDGVLQGPKCDDVEGNVMRAADQAIGKFIVKLNGRCVEAQSEAASLREKLTASENELASTRVALERERGKYSDLDRAFVALCNRYDRLNLWFGWCIVTIAAFVVIGGVAWIL